MHSARVRCTCVDPAHTASFHSQEKERLRVAGAAADQQRLFAEVSDAHASYTLYICPFYIIRSYALRPGAEASQYRPHRCCRLCARSAAVVLPGSGADGAARGHQLAITWLTDTNGAFEEQAVPVCLSRVASELPARGNSAWCKAPWLATEAAAIRRSIVDPASLLLV